MTKRIIYKTTEGGVAVIVPAESVEACMKDIPKGAEYAIVDTADIPTDRTFRNAWKNEGGIKVDMGKAKDITKDRLRYERKPLLEAQDVAFQRALENGADTSAIVKEKQRLRDITKQVDALTSLDELKALAL